MYYAVMFLHNGLVAQVSNKILYCIVSHLYFATGKYLNLDKSKILLYKPLPHMPILGSSNSAANKHAMS